MRRAQLTRATTAKPDIPSLLRDKQIVIGATRDALPTEMDWLYVSSVILGLFILAWGLLNASLRMRDFMPAAIVQHNFPVTRALMRRRMAPWNAVYAKEEDTNRALRVLGALIVHKAISKRKKEGLSVIIVMLGPTTLVQAMQSARSVSEAEHNQAFMPQDASHVRRAERPPIGALTLRTVMFVSRVVFQVNMKLLNAEIAAFTDSHSATRLRCAIVVLRGM